MNEVETMIKAGDGNYVTFWWDVSRNDHSSKLAGRPIFDQVLKARVNVPGDNKAEQAYEVERHFAEVKDAQGNVLKAASVRQHEIVTRQYGAELAAFKAKGAEAVDMRGTPVDQWPLIDRRMAAELKALHIHTVESLRDIGEAGIAAIGMGGRGLVAQAKAWLEQADGGAPIARLTEENEVLRAQNAELSATVKQLAERLDALEESSGEPKRKAGRPKKVEEAA